MSQYKTVKQKHGPVEVREKGSRFLSYIFRIHDHGQQEKILQELRKQYHDATHVCYAWIIKDNQQEDVRYSDDGEPSGTAGLPIFNELKFSGYRDILLAVIRYFGGVKLGTGGLVRAYGKAAREVINQSVPLIKYIKKELALEVPFSITGEIMSVVNKHKLEIIGREYTETGMNLRLSVMEENFHQIKALINNASAGKIKAEIPPQE